MASASSKNRTRSLTLEDEEDEEAHRKEETDLNEEQELDEEYDRDRAELNKEAETDEVAKHEEEANDDKIVASESAISEAEEKKMESEDKDANQEDESSLPINRNRGGTTVPSTIRTAPRRVTPDEEKEIVIDALALSSMKSFGNATLAMNQPTMAWETETDEDDDHEEADEDYDVNQEEEDDEYLKKLKASAVERERSKRRIMETKDDSEQTLNFLRRWETPEIPPEEIVCRSLIDKCSRPIRKQLTKRDVKQSRLALSKVQVRKKFLHLLEELKIPRGKEGDRVSVYGPDGKVHEMMMLPDEKNSPDLTTGWRKFVGDYELKEYCDFVTIWMFRHRHTQQICLAIHSKRFAFRKQVSKTISKAAFEDSD